MQISDEMQEYWKYQVADFLKSGLRCKTYSEQDNPNYRGNLQTFCHPQLLFSLHRQPDNNGKLANIHNKPLNFYKYDLFYSCRSRLDNFFYQFVLIINLPIVNPLPFQPIMHPFPHHVRFRAYCVCRDFS